MKNGLHFKRLFESYDDLNSISFNVDIPYFQEKYFFTIVGKPNNDIRKIDIEDSRWSFFKMKTKFYNIKKHNSFLIHEDYISEYSSPNENTKGYNLFFEDQTNRQKNLIQPNKFEYGNENEDDMFENLL